MVHQPPHFVLRLQLLHEPQLPLGPHHHVLQRIPLPRPRPPHPVHLAPPPLPQRLHHLQPAQLLLPRHRQISRISKTVCLISYVSAPLPAHPNGPQNLRFRLRSSAPYATGGARQCASSPSSDNESEPV